MPVLLLGGDTIIGGAQHRIINITILHRWDDGRRFASARPVDHAMRSMVAEQ